MNFADKIELGHMQYLKNAEGFAVGKAFIPELTVYGDVQSVRRTEYYKAQAMGKELAATVQLWAEEYHKNNALRHQGSTYSVERAYQKGDFVYLSCTLLPLEEGRTEDEDRNISSQPADGAAGKGWGYGATGPGNAGPGSPIFAGQHPQKGQGA